VLLLFGVATARITGDLLFLKFTETILHYLHSNLFMISLSKLQEVLEHICEN